MNDCDYMRLARMLAEKGCGLVSPNPMVGAVIVKEGKIIGSGYHERCGKPHAERNALSNCVESPQGATMYVTLEPCCHQGRQPPCVDAILNAGIRRVVVGSADPNPLVSGKGIQILRERGVEVTEGVLREECDQLNEVFFHYIQTKRPFVVMKYAMTMDGKIATFTGESRWITGEAARKHAHGLRGRYRAIMVGVGTVLKDDPLLTCRVDKGRNPLRVICDSQLITPLSAQVVATANDVPTVLATCCEDSARHDAYLNAGCRVLVLPQNQGHVDLSALMQRLGEEEIDSLLLEGGGTLHWSALRAGIVQKMAVYVAPKIFGGQMAKSPVEGEGIAAVTDAVRLKNGRVTLLGDDILIESEVDGNVYGNC